MIIANELKNLNENEELKKIFIEIIIFVVENINELAKECLQKGAKFSKYNSLIYFEKSEYFFSKYIGKPDNLSICDQKLVRKAEEITKSNQVNINEINSGTMFSFDESLQSDKLISSNNILITKDLKGLKYDKDEETERYQIILSNYEKILSRIMPGKESILSEQKKKAVKCIANIIKLNIYFLRNLNYQRYFELGKICKLFEKDKNSEINQNEDWYKEFIDLMEDIEGTYEVIKKKEEEMKKEIRKKNIKIFEEIDFKFIKKKNDQEFIDYILELKPYKGYENDKAKNVLESKKKEGLENMALYLTYKYNPDSYSYNDDDEQSKLDYCIFDHINFYLKRIITIIQ